MNMTDLDKLAVQGSAVGCYCLATHLPNQAFLLYSLTRMASHVADAEQVAMHLFHSFRGSIKDDNIFVYSSVALVLCLLNTPSPVYYGSPRFPPN